MKLKRLLYNQKADDIEDKRLSYALVGYFAAIATNSSLKTAFGLEDSGAGTLISMITFGVMALLIIRALLIVLKRNSSLFLRLYSLFLFVFIISIIINSIDNRPLNLIINYNLFWNFGLWIPLGCIAASIKDVGVLYRTLVNFSFLISFFLLLTFFKNSGTTNDSGSEKYDMTFGFAMALPALLHFNEFKKRKILLFLALGIIEFGSMILYGNRGALLPMIFYFIISFFHSNTKSHYKILSILLVATVGVFLFVFYDKIILWLVSFMSSHSIEHSRTLNMLIEDNLSDESGRDLLRTISFDMIMEKPILGWGFGGEYYEIAYRYSGVISGHIDQSFNSHNGIIQNLVNFGLLGGLISSYFCIRPLFGLRRMKSCDLYDIYLILGAVAIVPRLISATGFFINPDAAMILCLYFSKYRRVVKHIGK